MAEITKIVPQVKDKTRCSIYLDGRFCCGLTLECVMKNKLKVGVAVSDDELSAWQEESEKSVALSKALNYISKSEKTEKEVKAYLQKKGYLFGVQKYVIGKMKEYGYVDDSRYARLYGESAVKKKGKKLIALELRRKGIKEETVLAMTENLSGEETSVKTVLEKYMRGKETTFETKQKAYRYLLSKGYGFDLAKSAVDERFGENGNDD